MSTRITRKKKQQAAKKKKKISVKSENKETEVLINYRSGSVNINFVIKWNKGIKNVQFDSLIILWIFNIKSMLFCIEA